MKKIAIAFLAVIALGGCGSTHAKRYFEIRSVAPAETALPKVAKRLLVQMPSVDPLYDDTRILYRVSPFEIEYYPYEFWAEKPGKQIASAVADFLVKKEAFLGVETDPMRIEADILLRSRVHAVEEIDNPDTWLARLAMDYQFIDAKTGETLAAAAFDRSAQMTKEHVGTLPAVLSRILEEEIAKGVWELARALEKK
jgi:ABC-type uncharacterized transport system auxiliary subunit